MKNRGRLVLFSSPPSRNPENLISCVMQSGTRKIPERRGLEKVLRMTLEVRRGVSLYGET